MKLFYTFLMVSLSCITHTINSAPPPKGRSEVPTYTDEKPFIAPEDLPLIGVPEDFTSKLKKQLADQSARLSELQKILASLKDDKTKADELQSRTQVDLDKKETEAKDLKAQSRALEAENTKLKDQLRAAEDQSSTRTAAEKASAERDLQDLKAALATKESAVQRLEQTIYEQKAALAKADVALTDATKKLSEQKDTSSDLDAQASMLDDELGKKALKKATLDNARMQQQLLKILAALQRTDDQIDEIPADLERLKTAADEAKATAQRAIAQYAQQVEKTKALEAELAAQTSAAAELAKLQAAAAPTEKELAETKQQLIKIQEDAATTKKALDEKVAELANVQASIDKIKDSSATPAKQLKAKLVVLQQLISSQMPAILNKLMQLQDQVKTIAQLLKQQKESDRELIKIDSHLTSLQNALKPYMDRAQSTPSVGTSAKDARKIAILTDQLETYKAELQKLSDINADLTDQFNRMSQELALTQEEESSKEKTAALAETQKTLEDLKAQTAAELAAVKEETARKLAAIEDRRRDDTVADLKLKMLEGQVATGNRITDRTSELSANSSLSADASQVGMMALASGSRGVSPSAASVVDWRQSTIPISSQQMAIAQQYRQATSVLTNSPFYKPQTADSLATTVNQTTAFIAQYNAFIQKSLLRPATPEAGKTYWNALLNAIWKHADVIYKYGQTNAQRANRGVALLDQLKTGTYTQLQGFSSRSSIPLDPPLDGTNGIFTIIAGYRNTLVQIATGRATTRVM